MSRYLGCHLAFAFTATLSAGAYAQGAPAAPAAPAAAASAATAPSAAPQVTASGLKYLVLKEGTGPSPSASDIVRVNYRGTLLDGTEFDSSYKRGKPLEFKLSRVISCWTEGVQLMKVGGKARLTCPPELAYGARGAGVVPPNATLQFEVELVAIVKPVQLPLPAPAPKPAPAQ